jgi:NADPH:quinone reductase-like Zn-dependent oxidoreductase
LERIVELVQTGVVQVPEITTYPLSEVIAAHRVSEARHLRGKLILLVR